MQAGGVGSWYEEMKSIMNHSAKKKIKEDHHDRGRHILMKNYYWWRKYDEEKQLIGGLLGHPVAIDVKGGENVGRSIILPSITKGEIVG